MACGCAPLRKSIFTEEEIMICVGIDVGKNTHWACVANDRQTILRQPFAVPNDEAGFAKLYAAIRKHPKEKVVVGLEATSFYGENLITFLAGHGYKIALINPIQTNAIRKGNIRNAKNDKIDSRGVCKFLATNEYRLLQPGELQMMELRGLCRFRQTLRKSCTRLKTQLTSYLDLGFPEFHLAFSSVHGKGAYAALMEYPTAKSMQKANIVKLSGVLQKASRGRLGRARAEDLKLLAKRSVASKSRDMSLQIQLTIPQIRLVEEQIKAVEKQIEAIYEKVGSIIRTVPGIGTITGAIILSEIGDIKRFSSPGQLIAFAGLDPVVSQSGNYHARFTRMSKRGSSLLRFALVRSAWHVSRNNETFSNYYQEKLAQKGGHYRTLGHVAGKLCRVLFKMLRDDMAFNLP
jgi:transposase